MTDYGLWFCILILSIVITDDYYRIEDLEARIKILEDKLK